MSAGKGDKPRPVDGGKYRENFDAIFRKGKMPERWEDMPQAKAYEARLDAIFRKKEKPKGTTKKESHDNDR